MDLTVMQKAVADYGYLAIFAGTFLEGETVFLLGGVAAHQGLLNAWLVAATALAGGAIGDQFFFLLGWWRGPEVLARNKRLARKAVVARRLVRRHAVPLMLLSRFLYGLRMVIPLVCGASRIPPLVFLGLNLISAFCWVMVFGGIGYLFSGAVLSKLDQLHGVSALAGMVLMVVASAVVLARLAQKKLLGQTGEEPSPDR